MSGRIRTIKPELLEDLRTAGLTDAAFRLFVGMILLADDHGNLRAEPALLEGSVFWGSRHPRESLASLCEELARASLVSLYTVRGQKYAALNGWSKHQRVDKPSKPRVPGPDHEEAIIAGTCENPRETLASVSGESRESLASRARDLRPPTMDHRPPTTDPEQDQRSSAGADRSPALEVFEHWQRTLSPKSKPDKKRMGLIKARLKDGRTVEELKLAVDGCAASPWHMGENDRRTKYIDAELIFRDAAHVERFMALGEQAKAERVAVEAPVRRPPVRQALPTGGGNESAATAALERLSGGEASP